MIRTLCSIIKHTDILQNASAKDYCTFKVGGNLEFLICPKTLDNLCEYCQKLDVLGIKFKVLGNMSNILPQDNLNKGVFITTKFIADKPKFFGNFVTAYAGNMLSDLCVKSAHMGLSGLEKLIGIPATVGGAVYNNAGAFGQCIKDTLHSILIYKNGKVMLVNADYAKLDYRYSVFHTNNDIILSVTFKLKKADINQVVNVLKQTALNRATKQPNSPSAGSVFKKHNNISAGYLIEKAGLKGVIYNGAQISDIHANFIINLGTATSKSIKHLIDLAHSQVEKQFNISLKREIEYLGET